MTSFASFLKLNLLNRLPKTATAPFCPSEVQGSVKVDDKAPFWKKLLTFAGPGLLISVGYMDPGNWATDIEAGSKYGYGLLFVVLFSSVAAIVLQCLSMRLGLVSRRDLAKLCHEQFPAKANWMLWIFAEIAIIATDVAEVLGSALALHLLFGVALTNGILITALDTVIILGLKGKGFRKVEAIILGLISTIGICYFVELWWAKPVWHLVAKGLIPASDVFSTREPLYLAIAILGATVMPHNLYLHSSIIQTRDVGTDDRHKKTALRFATLDTVISLFFAFLVNAAILILAGTAFHFAGSTGVTQIDDAYHLLEPMVGGKFASLLFGVALLASGQSSTFTGTIAGQVLLEGFLQLKMPCWKRRVITRGLALAPALFGVWYFGDHGVQKLLVLSQVVLSLQLPFAIYPLIKFNRDKQLMGNFRSGSLLTMAGWSLFLLITGANLWLIFQLFVLGIR